MYKVVFYKDKNGKEPVFEYLLELSKKNDKNSRINLNKINDYIEILKQYGTFAGKPFVDHLEGDVWELRPLRNRILFFTEKEGVFVLLHLFIKKTQKTPKQEIEQAKREIEDLKERRE